jgi:hypothetical protein
VDKKVKGQASEVDQRVGTSLKGNLQAMTEKGGIFTKTTYTKAS